MRKIIFWVTALVLTPIFGFVSCVALIGGVASENECRPANQAQVVMTSANTDTFTTNYDFVWATGDEERNAVATEAGRAAIARGASKRDLELVVSTGLHESSLRRAPPPYGGAGGFLQQTFGILNSDGTPYWGTREQVENPTYATNRFLDELEKVRARRPGLVETAPFLEIILAVQNPNEVKYRKRWAENDFERIAKEVVANGLNGGEMPEPGSVTQAVAADYNCDDSTNIAERVITLALTQTGATYSQAPGLRENPGTSFDCSGLTHWAYGQLGIEVGANSYEQWEKSGPRVLDVTGWTEQNESEWLSGLQRGDLLFWFGEAGGHVGIYMGGDQIFDASSPSRPIGQHTIAWVFESGKRFVGATRPASRADIQQSIIPASNNSAVPEIPIKVPYRVTSEYGGPPTALRFWTVHDGIDFGANCGTPVYAVLGGTTSVTRNKYQGLRVTINHGTVNGVELQTRYHHLSSTLVSDGDIVTADQQIGAVGDTGNTTGCHLHFGVDRNGEHSEPRNFFAKWGIRL